MTNLTPFMLSKVKDVSQDRPHQLPDEVLKKYAAQIKFLDSFGDSGAYLFQSYRQSKVLAVGSGPFLVSLVAALFESGLSKFHVLITDSLPTNRQRLTELAEHARKTDPEATIKEITHTLLKKGVSSWREAVQPVHSILYVSQEGDVEELRALHAVCREEKKVLLPAICVQQAGLAGPLIHPGSEGCWESAWRRIHQSALCKDPQLHTFFSAAGAILANLIVFELLKTVSGVSELELNNKLFLLNLQTLEGNLHSFMPHPLVTGHAAAERVQDFDQRLEQSPGKGKPDGLLPYFSRLTSAESGIFHIWEEGELKQLPLAQCRVQAADPLSDGPAELLPEIVCTGLTHEEARREAGLAGIEAYVSRMAGLFVKTLPSDQEEEGSKERQEFVGVGAGETFAEGVSRGLHMFLTKESGKRLANGKPFVKRVRLSAVEDERCRFYLQALTTMQGAPAIGLGEELSGFPEVWVGARGRWYGCIGLNKTMALRKALQLALWKAQNQTACLSAQGFEVSSVILEEKLPLSLAIPASEEAAQPRVLQSAIQVLERNRKRLLVFNMAVEPFLQEEPVRVFGVQLREEESR